MQHWELLIFFFVIAFIYSSVGFGGGSSYLAVLAVYQLPVYEMKLTALVCNIIVVTAGTILFIRHHQVDWKKILPLILLSVPLAFAGAWLKISTDAFFVLLGVSLIAASLLLVVKTTATDQPAPDSPVRSGLIGGAIGFLSGMVSIGGGIFLSPILHLLRWDVPKKIAATASVFILVNSISSLVAHLSRPMPADVQYSRILLLCIAVFAGGQAGSRIGITRLNPIAIRRVTALLVFAAGVEVLLKHTHVI
jgi:uncharacterized membrane protein YfcA